MAVVKPEPPAFTEKHSKFYDLGTKLERYLLGGSGRARGSWLPRKTPNEDKMHRIAMLRFYRFCRFVTRKEFLFSHGDADANKSKVHESKRNQSNVWYSHNITMTFEAQIKENESTLFSRKDGGYIPIMIPQVEKRPIGDNEDRTEIRVIVNHDPPKPGGQAEVHLITMNPDRYNALRGFLYWVTNSCPPPDDRIRNNEKLCAAYDQEIYDHIFEALGLSQYMLENL